MHSMMDLAGASPFAAHWSEEQYRRLFSPDERAQRLTLVVEGTIAESVPTPSHNPESLLGFIVARHLAPEWELENIVVNPAVRRRGIGKWLLEALLAAAHETNSESVFLEVRESNHAACALYERAGFRPDGRRKSYYSSPPEDALLYRLSLH